MGWDEMGREEKGRTCVFLEVGVGGLEEDLDSVERGDDCLGLRWSLHTRECAQSGERERKRRTTQPATPPAIPERTKWPRSLVLVPVVVAAAAAAAAGCFAAALGVIRAGWGTRGRGRSCGVEYRSDWTQLAGPRALLPVSRVLRRIHVLPRASSRPSLLSLTRSLAHSLARSHHGLQSKSRRQAPQRPRRCAYTPPQPHAHTHVAHISRPAPAPPRRPAPAEDRVLEYIKRVSRALALNTRSPTHSPHPHR